MILKSFFAETKLVTKLAIWTLAWRFYSNSDHSICFQEKRQCFRPKSVKTTEKLVIVTLTPGQIELKRNHKEVLKFSYLNINVLALAAWRSGHHIRFGNRRPGFESRKDIRFLGEILQCYYGLLT
jgi:hypothetical protein